LQYSQDQWDESLIIAKTSKKEIESLNEKVKQLEKELQNERECRIRLETLQKKKNLIMLNVMETAHETQGVLEDTVQEIITKWLEITDAQIDTCYRMGKKPQNDTGKTSVIKSRPIKVEFIKISERNKIWANKRKFKGSNIILKEDLPRETDENIKKLSPVFKEARRQKLKTSMIQDKLIVDGQQYTVDTLDTLPDNLKPINIATKETENEIYFWGSDSPLSNFYTTDCSFMHEGKVYNCVEQYYAHEKAKFFNDDVAAKKILTSKNPSECKNQRINGFKKQTWNTISRKVMTQGIRLKFSQNQKLGKILKDTGNKILVEASPHDDYWGIGIDLHSPDLHNKSKWGKNILGQIIMEIRDQL
jgi:hypothetical protein